MIPLSSAQPQTPVGVSPLERVLVLPEMLKYSRLRGRQHYPLQVKNYLIRRLLGPLIDRLKPGDVVWVQNQPDFARFLSPLVRKTGSERHSP